MDDYQDPYEQQDESLADVPLTPVDAGQALPGGGLVPTVVTLAAGGAFMYFVVASSMTPTMGATRSGQLEWERRNMEIEQAELDAQNDSHLEAKTDGKLNDADRD
jgi:hypothetical protein